MAAHPPDEPFEVKFDVPPEITGSFDIYEVLSSVNSPGPVRMRRAKHQIPKLGWAKWGMGILAVLLTTAIIGGFTWAWGLNATVAVLQVSTKETQDLVKELIHSLPARKP
jgi:hypothetical protein